MNNNNIVCFSRKTEHWQTPPELFSMLHREFNFRCDPCTTEDNPLNTEIFYTAKDDGLTKRWYDSTYCNPPYGKEISLWIKKAIEEQHKGVTTVMNIPARTDTKWFHDYVYNKPDIELRFLKGRVKFIGVQKDYIRNSAPFPSMLVIFRKKGVIKE